MARQQLIQFRRGTASAWTTANPILAAGEEGFETDTYKFKIGDGTTSWTSLPYAKIDESNLLHISGTETVTGAKTFPSTAKIAGSTNTWGFSASGAALENLGSNDTFYKTQNNMYFQPNNGGITKVSIVGGKLILDGGDPTTALGASTKQYTDAAATKVKYAVAYVGLTTGDYPVSSYSNVHSAINAAITAVNSAGGGIVKLGAGTFNITGQIIPASNVRLVGESMIATTLLGGVGSGYTIAKTGNGGVDNFSVEDLTIDTNNVASAAGIRLEYATNCSIKNVEIKNTKSWQIVLSTTDGTDTNYRNSDILIQDVRLSGKDSSLGSILLNNSQRVKINRTKITTISGPSIELYQVLNDIDITKSTITNTAGVGAYYSLSTNNIRFSDCSFIGGSLSGANRSDNGAFGATQALNVSVDNCYFKGNSSGVQIGAVDNMKVTSCTFDGCADIGIIIDDGNNPVSAMPTNYLIDNCTIKNSNTNNTSHSIHPGILFKEIGGAQYGKITNNLFYDSQSTKTQRFPISFNGNFTYNNIEILNNRLSADTANGGTSIVLTDSAVLGANVLIQGNTDYSGTNPAQAVVSQADATTTSKGAVQLAGDLGGTASSPTTPTAVHITGNETIAGVKTLSSQLNANSGVYINNGVYVYLRDKDGGSQSSLGIDTANNLQVASNVSSGNAYLGLKNASNAGSTYIQAGGVNVMRHQSSGASTTLPLSATGGILLGTSKATSSATPTNTDDLVNKAYADSLAPATKVEYKRTYVVGTNNANYILPGTASGNRTALQQAIDDANAAGGAEIVIKDSSVTIDGVLTLKSNIDLHFTNSSGTIKLANGANSGIFTTASASINNLHVYNMTLDGNGANQTDNTTTGGAMFRIAGTGTSVLENILIENVIMKASYKHCFFITGDNNSNNIKVIRNCKVLQHGVGSVGFGLYCDYAPGTIFFNNRIQESGTPGGAGNYNDAIELGHLGGTALANILDGGQLQFPFGDNSIIANNTLESNTIQNDGNTANNVIITGNKVKNATPIAGFGGISVTGLDAIIANNVVKSTANFGIRSYGNGHSIVGNKIDGTNKDSGVSNGVYIDNTSYGTVLGNRIKNCNRALAIVYDYNVISANTVENCNVGLYCAPYSSSGHTMIGNQAFGNVLDGAATQTQINSQTTALGQIQGVDIQTTDGGTF